jgi:hypothetical protein
MHMHMNLVSLSAICALVSKQILSIKVLNFLFYILKCKNYVKVKYNKILEI